MKSKENNKIKKLRKAHILPSVIFLIFTIILSGLASVCCIAVMLIYQLKERIDVSLDNAEMICSSLGIAGVDARSVLGTLNNDPDSGKCVFILDEGGGISAGFGTPTFGSKPFKKFDGVEGGERDFTYYPDTDSSRNLVKKNGELNVGSFFFDDVVFDNDFMSTKIHEARFWVSRELSGGGTVMIKCSAPLYMHDLNIALVTGSIAMGITLLPIIFLFVNVILSFKNQRRMTRLIFTDPITSGNSYVYFEHTAGKALTSRFKLKKFFMIVDLTLTKYRSYCNYYGIREGELILAEIHTVINSYMGKGEFAAHQGKASFVLFMSCADKESGEKRVKDMINELSERFAKTGMNFHAGIFFSRPPKSKKGKRTSRRVTDPAVCVNCAAAARATIADDNAGGTAVYNYKLLEEQLWEHKVEERMAQALENEEFHVYIQPKYDPVTEELAGAEALVRWINEEDGFIPPGRFIPIFEKNGFITKLDDYMLAHVAKLQAQWIKEGKKVVPISVNVSRAHFADPGLAGHICSIVDEYEVPHHVIEIELTESAFFDDKEALLRTVRSLSSLGFEISMDDFGAGYSSLNSLKDLPLDVLKLDADFFRGDSEANRGEIVVSQAITLAKKLNMRIVAEGVEKKEQVDFLAGQGCDMIQGFYFAKPMPAEEYGQKLEGTTA